MCNNHGPHNHGSLHNEAQLHKALVDKYIKARQENDYRTALEYLHKLIAAREIFAPKSARDFEDIAELHFLLKEYDTAIQEHNNALELYDNDAIPLEWYEKQGIYHYAVGRYQEALEYFLKAIALFDVDDSNSQAYHHTENCTESHPDMSCLSEHYLFSYHTLLGYAAMTYFQLHDLEKTQEYCKKALKAYDMTIEEIQKRDNCSLAGYENPEWYDYITELLTSLEK